MHEMKERMNNSHLKEIKTNNCLSFSIEASKFSAFTCQKKTTLVCKQQIEAAFTSQNADSGCYIQ